MLLPADKIGCYVTYTTCHVSHLPFRAAIGRQPRKEAEGTQPGKPTTRSEAHEERVPCAGHNIRRRPTEVNNWLGIGELTHKLATTMIGVTC